VIRREVMATSLRARWREIGPRALSSSTWIIGWRVAALPDQASRATA
jgi:hypothetical protein